MASKVLSLHGKGLKLDTKSDVEPWIKDLDPTTIEEIHMGGNTFGVDASEALAEFLQKAIVLKVTTSPKLIGLFVNQSHRSRTLQTSLLDVSSLKFHSP
jgi:Ran GTPase-activating protein (RanGAP) involved in mRNA processing and transport